MTAIFISYRRQDMRLIAGRIFDKLEAKLGRGSVFMDIDCMPFGVDFHKFLGEAAARARIVLVLIGPGWAEAKDEAGRRLDKPDDFVHTEVESALKRNTLVVPMLIDSAPMPRAEQLPESMRAFLRFDAARVDAGRDFHPHRDQLISDLERHLNAEAGPLGRAAGGGTQFTILVAQLEGGADYPEMLSIGAGDQAAVLAAAETRGRRWLMETNADVLIWGEEGAKDRVLRLRFLTPEGQGGAAKPYTLNETLELPAGFGADLRTLLAAQTATAISPVYDRAGEALAALIAHVVAKLKPLAENPPPKFADQTRARLWHACAAGEERLGEERGDNARLATAIAFYKKVLSAWTCDRAPLDWAMAQNNLGNALSSFGERESGTARREEAVSAYRAAGASFYVGVARANIAQLGR